MGTWYTDKNTFLAAVTGEITDTYDDLSGNYAGSLSRLSGKVEYSSPYGLNIIQPNSINTLTTDEGNETLSIAITTLATELNSAGGTFNITDASGSSFFTGTVIFEFYEDAVLLDTYTHTQNTENQFFIGYIPSDISVGSAGELKANGPGLGLYIGTSETILGLASLISVNYIDTAEELSVPMIELSIDSINVTSEELLSNENYLYPENYLEPNSITSEEIIILENIYAQAFIDVPSIQSAESFKKPLIFPTPYPGRIYFWYEQIHSIEFELNVRSQQ